ncbi:MAG TPA: histone deacetylase [Candidatus Dormibacteraeota bacterium]
MGPAGAKGPGLVLLYDDLFLEHSSPGHPESPERLLAIRARLTSEPALGRCRWQSAPSAIEEDVRLIHSGRHLARVQELSDAGGGWLDPDTYCGKRSFQVALRALGVAMAAVEVATGEEPAPALALVRPPGHHATPEQAMGFCLFNNAAVAVRHAQRRLGIGRVAVVDLDVHHGNGTQDAFYQDGRVLYCSLHQLPLYPGTGLASEHGTGAGLGANLNVPLPHGSGPRAWLAALRQQVLPALHRHRPELILVSAGFDALAGDPLAQLELDPEAYAAAAELLIEAAAELGAAPTVWLLEGGYHLERMPEAVRRCALLLDQAARA